jgi:peptide/nickel transport system permease protein
VGRFIARRLLQGLIVIMLLTVSVFVVTRLIGDPVDVMLPLEATPELRAEFRHALGLDQPIPVQFADYVSDLSRGDFGESLWQRRPAIDVIKETLPYTLQLVTLSVALAVVVAVPLGTLAATRPGSPRDQITTTMGLVGLSMPEFWVGLLLIVIFAVQLGWFPVAGAGTPSHYVLPVITMSLPILARLTMVVRSSMVDELNEQYIQTARAKNLPTYRVIGVHALRNASVPIVTLTGWEFIRALAGYTVLVETVFAWPGLGFTATQAILQQDLILLQAIVFVIAILVTFVNIGIDILYKLIDPRIKLA